MEIFTDYRDVERPRNEQDYYNRLLLHRRNVFKAFKTLIDNPATTITLDGVPVYNYADRIRNAVENHDASKFGDEEFDAYRVHWHPTTYERYLMANDKDFEKKCDEEYEQAVLHHLANNDHHPDFWCMGGVTDANPMNTMEIRDMPIEAILHMLCDWDGMAYENGGNTKIWWAENREKKSKKMSPKTIEIVDQLVAQFPDTVYKSVTDNK